MINIDTENLPDALSQVLIRLLKGVVYQEEDNRLWQQLLEHQARVRDYVAVLGLELMLDEAEGYAWLRTRPVAEGEPELPRLMARRPLSYPISLLIALLRRKLAEVDTQGGELRVILDREDIVDMLRTFLPAGTNEARLVDRIDSHINRVAELGFVRRLKGQPDKIEIRRILKAYVDAQWLEEFDRRLAEYREHLDPDAAAEQGGAEQGEADSSGEAGDAAEVNSAANSAKEERD